LTLSTEIVGLADVVFLDAATGLANVTTEAMAKMVESAAALIMGSSLVVDANVGLTKVESCSHRRLDPSQMPDHSESREKTACRRRRHPNADRVV